MANTDNIRRDGRNSAKRLKSAIADALRAKHQACIRAFQNSSELVRLIEASGIARDVDTHSIQWHRLGANHFRDHVGFVADFLGVKETRLANDKLVRKYFNLLWYSRFEGKTHVACKARALADQRIPIWHHLVGTDRCPCCSLPLGCEHEKFRTVTQSECKTRGIFHGGRCYHVSECTSCGVITGVDSSD